jgi:mono/diheme cytochrome c family protein
MQLLRNRTTVFMVTLAAAISLLAVSIHARPTAVPAKPADATPTFYRDVAPILQQHCEICHRADGIAPMPLQTYSQAKAYAGAIAASAKTKSMPPWFAVPGIGHFSNDPSLTPDQIAALSAWAAAGAPAGEAKDAPQPILWAASWTIPEPDVILPMTKGVAIPRDGEVDYTYEIVPTHFVQDRWVQSVEVLPSLRANVHHAVVYIRPPGSNWMRHAPIGIPFTADELTDPEDRRGAHWTDADVLLVYAPGSSPDEFPPTMGKFIPSGADLVFQMHYTTNGHAATDTTRVGLRFAKTPPPKRVLTLQLTNDHFVIPPGAPDYRVEARGTLPNDAILLSLFPHMHLRGKRFEYNIVNPIAEGRNLRTGEFGPKNKPTETLLHVNYHFHWQMSYKLAQPLLLKAGTELEAIAWYDNSKNNPHNPDPEAAVRWGDQTYDEMMVGFFDVAVDGNIDKKKFFERSSHRMQ